MLTLDTTVSATPLMSHVNPLAGVPELKSYLVTDDFEKREALKLVADSVAQQRQAANRALLYHPLNMAVAVAVLGALVQFLAHRGYDALMIGMTCIGLLMAAMAACRYATQEYIHAAEDINFRWLGDADILVSTFGDEIIGTVMIEWKSGESRTKKKKAWRGLIRAWTTKLKYRGNGVGAALLEDAVKHSKKKGAEALDFSTHHASE
jgi:GNAT superfamily N-acetyltransferase